MTQSKVRRAIPIWTLTVGVTGLSAGSELTRSIHQARLGQSGIEDQGHSQGQPRLVGMGDRWSA